MGVFKNLRRSVRARIFKSIFKELASLAKENESLRQELMRLRKSQDSSEQNSWHDQLRQLELLLTEHPRVDSRGLSHLPFPSPAVSVVLPTWNRADLVADAINSVQEQSFKDWELVVIDDGSTDHTADVMANFTSDPRIRYIRQSHTGSAVARNHGLRLAKGSLVAYVDSDNLWYPDFLTAAVTAFANDPDLDCAYGALVSDAHGANHRILFQPFDRAELVKENFIDLNTFVHRRSLADLWGVFDEALDRLVDWDLILRYTQTKPARRLPVLAARYRVLDQRRVTDNAVLGTNLFRVRRKWMKQPQLPRPMRVLYVLWHYPQLSESYIESEILCMKRWGVHIEVWSEVGVASPYEPSVPVHHGTLEEAIAKCQPDLLHIHWVQFALGQGEKLNASGLQITLRAHGFEVTDEGIRQLLKLPRFRRGFFFAHQLKLFADEPRLTVMPAAFDTALFEPAPKKDRQLVLRTGSALPSKDLEVFFETAERLPSHRFILAIVTCKHKESYVDEVTALAKKRNSPVDILLDVPRNKIASLVRDAGLYLHTALPPDRPGGTPIGMPISIAEAMATGAHVLVRDMAPLNTNYGSVASLYRDARHAAELIAESATWPEEKWKKAWAASVDHAFMQYADETTLRPIFDEWCAIFQARNKS